MARPTIFKHRKFRRLVAVLGIPEPHVLGHLECLWHAAYECGDDRLGDAIDVELAARWEGDPGVFTAALMECGGDTSRGFIVEEDGVFRVHDLYDHAPDYVRKRKLREEQRREKAAERRRKESKSAERRTTADNGGQRLESGGHGPVNGHTPAPAPAPAPTPREKYRPTDSPREPSSRGPCSSDQVFDYHDLRLREYRERTGGAFRAHGRTAKLRAKVRAELKARGEAQGLQDFRDAIDGLFASEWHRSRNNLTLQHVLNGTQLDKLADEHRSRAPEWKPRGVEDLDDPFEGTKWRQN